MIPEAAVEAAFQAMWGPNPSNASDSGDVHLLKELRKALEAAAPHMTNAVTQWGLSFVHNGAFYREYPTREDAQAFADEMAEVDAHLVVVSREYVPAVYGEWKGAK